MDSHEFEYVKWKFGINKGCSQNRIVCGYVHMFEYCTLVSLKLCWLHFFQLIENLILCTLTHYTLASRALHTLVSISMSAKHHSIHIMCGWVCIGRLDVVVGYMDFFYSFIKYLPDCFIDLFFCDLENFELFLPWLFSFE